MNSRNHPDEAESGRRFRPDIEGLRAVAIIAVSSSSSPAS
jgi:peptidoglycan/LPS O-acetylase OafA/YrhL